MRVAIVLAMHGTPPSDIPERDVAELMRLHGALEHALIASERRPELAEMERRYLELDHSVRTWPRNPDNDPFYHGSVELAALLSKATGQQVFLGFNEFCAPSIGEALEQAAMSGAETVVAVTPMTTRGGGHSERDIPRAIGTVAEKHPEVRFTYAWPYDQAAVASFLAAHVGGFLLEREPA
jgi:sirohydrochlorin cobaltochelatase